MKPNPIRYHRFLNGISQFELASRVNVSQPLVSMWEAGWKIPSPEQYELLGKALCVPPEKLQGGKQ